MKEKSFDSSTWSLTLWLCLVMAACVGVWFASQPPEAIAAGQEDGTFSAHAAMARLEAIAGPAPAPRVVASEENARARRRITAQLESMGLVVHVQRERVCNRRCAEVHNIIAHPPAARDTTRFTALSAHHDSVSAGPGIADDLAGVAAILEIASSLGEESYNLEHDHAALFLITDGEETGLFGAEAFARHPIAARTDTVINLEARGSTGRSFIFETTQDSGRLIEYASRSLTAPAVNSLAPAVYERLPNGSDLHVHRDAARSGVNMGFFAELAHYHTPLDDLEHLDLDSLQHQGQNADQMLRAILADPTLEDPGRVVYFDILGDTIIAWPEDASAMLVALALFLLLVTTSFGLWGRTGLSLSARLLLADLFKPLMYLFMVSIATLWLHWVLTDRAGSDFFWRGGREFVVWGYALITVYMMSVFNSFESEYASKHIWLGHWIFFSFQGLALAYALPAVSFVFVGPCLVAAFVSPLLGRFPRFVFGVSAIAGACIWLPLLWALIDGVELVSSLLVVLPVSWLMLAMMPLTSELGLIREKTYHLGMIILIATVGAWVWHSPTATPERPNGLNFLVVQEHERDQALVYAQNLPMDLLGRRPPIPRSVSDVVGQRVARDAVKHLARDLNGPAKSDRLDIPPPELEWLGQIDDDLQLVRVRSARSASILTLAETSGATIQWLPAQAASMDDETLRTHLKANLATRYAQRCFGWDAPCEHIPSSQPIFAPAEDGVRVLVQTSYTDLELEIRDITSGLPPEVGHITNSRPDWATPIHFGDLTIYQMTSRIDPAAYGPM